MSIKLPGNVTVYAGGMRWRGEIPADLCPVKYRPRKVAPGKVAVPRKPRSKRPVSKPRG